MQDQLAIFACSHLVPELRTILKKGSYPDVRLFGYPAQCLKKVKKPGDLAGILGSKGRSFNKSIIIASTCFRKSAFTGELPANTEMIHLEHCQEIILNKETICHFVQQGYYIITNGWLRSLNKNIRDWGFDATLARSFFNESMKKILFLDTGLPGKFNADVIRLSEYMGLPYERLPVGLSHCENYLKGIIADWRADRIHHSMSDKIAALTGERADYLVIVNQLRVLVDLKQESQIAQEVFFLLTVLFAPGAICYRQFNEGAEIRKIFYNNKTFNVAADKNRSFDLEVSYQGEMLGIFELSEIKFPEHIEKYKRLGRIISQICSLAIANARKYELMEKQKEELTMSNRSKDKFFSILAHDLRSPLHALIGLTDILNENLESFSSDELQEYIKGLNKSAVNLSGLLENLLEWSRVNRGIMEFRPENLPLLTLVKKSVAVFREALVRKSITIRQEIDESLTILADHKMVDSVIRNLLSNAIKFTPREGSIQITAERIPGNMIMISMADTGIGMNNELQENLFKLEAKISRPGTEDEPSTGLGLLLSKEFVEKHGGSIWAESLENQGSTFRFTLPSG